MTTIRKSDVPEIRSVRLVCTYLKHAETILLKVDKSSSTILCTCSISGSRVVSTAIKRNLSLSVVTLQLNKNSKHAVH